MDTNRQTATRIKSVSSSKVDQENIFLVSARMYLENGQCPIPLNGKAPVGTWKQFQTELPTEGQLEILFAESSTNIGLVQGKVSGTFAVDIDGAKGEVSWAELCKKHDFALPTATVKTGRGRHLYFALPRGITVRTRANLLPGIDIRGEGGYVVAPPSIHSNGSIYKWSLHPDDEGFAEPPAWLIELVTGNAFNSAAENTKAQGQAIDLGYRDTNGKLDESRLVHEIKYGIDWHGAMLKFTAKKLATDTPLNEIYTMAPFFTRSDLINPRTKQPYTVKDTLLDLEVMCEHGQALGWIKPEQAGGFKVGTQEWPIPSEWLISKQSIAAPDCPTELFGESFAILSNDIAQSKGAPVDFVAASLLAVGSGLIGNARKISPWSGWEEPMALNLAAVGLPSSGKSPALDPAISVAREIEKKQLKEFEKVRREYETNHEIAQLAEKQWKKDVETAVNNGQPPPSKPENAVLPEEPAPPYIVLTDYTPEKLARIEASNPRGLILYRDELAGMIESCDNYGNSGGRQFILEGFGGRSYRVDRVKDDKPTIIERHLFSILGGIQPDKLNTLLFNGDDDGLSARFLFLHPNQPSLTRPEKNYDHQQLRRSLEQLHDIEMIEGDNGPEPFAVRMTEEAAAVFHNFRKLVAEREKQSTGLFLSFMGKIPGMTARLSGLLAFLDYAFGDTNHEPMKIERDHVARARDLFTTYFMPMAERVYGAAAWGEAERYAAAIAKEILARRPERINAKIIRDESWIKGLREAKKVNAALQVLEHEDWIKPDPQREGMKKGRRRSDYLVNPLVFAVRQSSDLKTATG